MIKVKVVSKDKYEYGLLDDNGKMYNMNIGFNNINFVLELGDYLYLTREMLNEANIYTFGPLKKKASDIQSKDIIKIITENDEFFLQRYYG